MTITSLFGSSGITGGSGWIVKDSDNKYFIVTAAHVVINPFVRRINLPNDSIWAFVSNVNGTKISRYYTMKIICIDGAGDMALLGFRDEEIIESGRPSGLFFNENFPKLVVHPALEIGNNNDHCAGDFCAVLGDPLIVDYRSIATGVIRDPKYVISGFNSFATEQLFIDVDTSGGNSGSCIVDKDCKVIGMLTFGFSGADSLVGGPAGEDIKRFVNDCFNSIRQDSDTAEGAPLIASQTGTPYNYTRYLKGFLGILTSFTLAGFSTPRLYAFNPANNPNEQWPDQNVRGLSVSALIPPISAVPGLNPSDVVLRIGDGTDTFDLGVLDEQHNIGKVTWRGPPGSQVSITHITLNDFRTSSATTQTNNLLTGDWTTSRDRPIPGDQGFFGTEQSGEVKKSTKIKLLINIEYKDDHNN